MEYRELEKNTKDDIEKLYELYNLFNNKNKNELKDVLIQMDIPIIYKELVLYPVKTLFYTFFHTFVECLILPKHKVGNVKIITMSYLDYLVYKDDKIDNSLYAFYFEQLLLLCTRKPKDYTINIDGKDVIKPRFEFFIKDNKTFFRFENTIYDKEDFNKIQEIICNQNSVDMPDITMHPDLEKKYEEYKAYMRKINNIKLCNFEGTLLSLMATTGFTKEYLLNISIRTFNILIERVGYIMEYQLNTLLSPNLKEETIKKLPKHWLCEVEKIDKFKEMTSSFEEMQQKIKT